MISLTNNRTDMPRKSKPQPLYLHLNQEIDCSMKDYDLLILPSGIRVVHKQISNSKIAHCGFILDIGSRDENPEQQGIAHFWEHMAFKGTKKRKSFHILNRLDSLGGELNAYTTKEKICFYASVMNYHFEKALDLLKDITFDSIFPENQIERERNVILEEMALYIDNPEDAIQDDFDHLIFAEHPLGYNILGTKTSVRSFQKHDFDLFIKQNLNTEKVIFSSVSNLPSKKVFKLAEKYLKDIPSYHSEKPRLLFKNYLPRTKLEKKPITQAQCGIGRTAYPINNTNRLPFLMLVNILGGPAMNSRLNLALREKYGFVYAVEANYAPFIDTGLFSIFFGTEKKQLYRCVDLVIRELKKLKQNPLGTLQMHKAREQFLGQMAMAEENNISLMLMMGKSLLDLGIIESYEEVVQAVHRITAQQLFNLSNEVFAEDAFSFLYFVPKD